VDEDCNPQLLHIEVQSLYYLSEIRLT